MLKSHVFLESKNHRVRCAPPVRHCPAGPPARKRTRGGTSGSNRGPASRTTGRRTRGGTGGSNRGPASRTTAPLAKEICNLKFQIYFFKNIFVRVSELLTSLLFIPGETLLHCCWNWINQHEKKLGYLQLIIFQPIKKSKYKEKQKSAFSIMVAWGFLISMKVLKNERR